MSEQKRYTAQEMRKAADGMLNSGIVSRYDDNSQRYGVRELRARDISAMLRQAADAEDELAKAKRPDACPANPTNKMCYLSGEYCCDAVRYLQKEIAQLKARLEAVVKECEKSLSRFSCTSCRSRCKMENDIPECENPYLRCEVQNYNAILRVARGEGGAE